MTVTSHSGSSLPKQEFLAGVRALLPLLLGVLPFGMIFGALASATAPAATVDVLAEYDAEGPLTTSLLKKPVNRKKQKWVVLVWLSKILAHSNANVLTLITAASLSSRLKRGPRMSPVYGAVILS